MSKALLALSTTGKNYKSSATCNYVFPPLCHDQSAYGMILDLKSLARRLLHNITSTPIYCALLIAEIHHVNTERMSSKHKFLRIFLTA